MRAKGFLKWERERHSSSSKLSRDGCIKTQKRPEKKGEKMRVISYWKATRVIKHQTIAFSKGDNNFQGILESILTTKLGSDLVINWQPLWLLSILFCTVYNSCYFEGELVLSIMRCIEPSIINLKFPSRWWYSSSRRAKAGNESIDWWQQQRKSAYPKTHKKLPYKLIFFKGELVMR